MRNVNEIVEQYRKAGFRPIPLTPFDKRPLNGISFDLIEHVEFKQSNNIGLFMGSQNGLIVLDLDDEHSQEYIVGKFREIGWMDKFTTVRTPNHRGLHIYLKCFDVPEDAKSFYRLNPDIGKGELRLHYPAYCVAPGSVLKQGEYYFEQGGVEVFSTQPEIEWSNIIWVLPEDKIRKTKREMISQSANVVLDEHIPLPIRLVYQDVPKAANGLAKVLQYSKREQKVKWGEKTYPTTSEAEAALVMDYVLAGRNYDQIERYFESIASPHYRESGENYLRRLYNKVVDELAIDETRQQIAEAYQYAMSIPWPGSNGGDKLKVMLALLASAWQWRTFQPFISYRTIGEYASVNKNTAHNLVRELQEDGYIHLLEKNKDKKTQQYDISLFVNGKKLYITTPPTPVTNVSILSPSPAVAELWSRKYLGSSSFLIYIHLSPTQPHTVKELSDLTGKNEKTVMNNIKRLVLYDMAVMCKDGSWLSGPAVLEDVATKLGTDSSASGRRRKHRMDRENNRRRMVRFIQQMNGPIDYDESEEDSDDSEDIYDLPEWVFSDEDEAEEEHQINWGEGIQIENHHTKY